MHLNKLLQGLPLRQRQGDANPDIQSVVVDSRQVVFGSLFVAIRGTQTDGHQYINSAIERGAAALLVETLPKESLPEGLPVMVVNDTAFALGQVASQFYGKPSEQMRLVGITGTNGKTTVATLLYCLFMKLGYTVGLISTVEHKIGEEVITSTHTTPDAITVNQLLQQMQQAGCEFVFMEVSSHAVDQKRIAGLVFEGGIFTNISHDHLDYHRTFQAYIKAKQGFFDQLPPNAFALTNIDDRRGNIMVQNTHAKCYTYALRQAADFKTKILENTLTGLILELEQTEFYARLVGKFNAYNLLAVYATACLLEANQQEVLAAMSNLQAPSGRFEYVRHPDKNIMGLVDYAHTPDALENVLQTIDQVRTGAEQVITVIGCGGDRDKTKRPLMAKVACAYSQQVILTSDNPRTESPEAILDDMQSGVPPYAASRTLVITDRRQAIRTACRLAQPGDIVLVAGKGHETYQEIDGVKHPFDDKKELQHAWV